MSNRTCGAVNTCWYGAQSYLSSNSQGFKIWKMEIWRQSTFLPEAGLWKQLGEWVRKSALSLSFKCVCLVWVYCCSLKVLCSWTMSWRGCGGSGSDGDGALWSSGWDIHHDECCRRHRFWCGYLHHSMFEGLVSQFLHPQSSNMAIRSWWGSEIFVVLSINDTEAVGSVICHVLCVWIC